MTGAASSTVVLAREASFLGSLVDDGDPDYYLPGRNPTLEEISIANALQRMDDPNAVEAVDSVAGNFEGALSATWTMSADTHADVRETIFNDAGGGFVAGAAASARWYTGVDHLNGTAERELLGVIPLEYSVTYQQETNTIRESLTAAFADENRSASITPSNITGPTDGNDVAFHGASLSVDGATVEKLQSATLSISNIARFHRGPSRTPEDAVIAQPRTTLQAEAIFGGTDTLERAYGGAGASDPQDRLSSVSGELAFSAGGQSVAAYTLPELKPESYDWTDLVAGDADLTDPVTYHVNGGVTVA